MRYFLSHHQPSFSRVLLIESGSRSLLEPFVLALFEAHGHDIQVDLVTCYAGVPKGLPTRSRVYRVSDYIGASGRKRLYGELRSNGYNVLAVICSGEPIMTKWKWALAAKVPAKVLVINENGDQFWVDRFHWKTIRHFVMFRAGFTGADAPATLARIAFFPFTFLYLLAYAGTVHLKRQLRRMVRV